MVYELIINFYAFDDTNEIPSDCRFYYKESWIVASGNRGMCVGRYMYNEWIKEAF